MGREDMNQKPWHQKENLDPSFPFRLWDSALLYGFSSHWHELLEVNYILKGKIPVMVDGRSYQARQFRLSGPLLLVFVIGMMIPVHTTLIPVYQMTKALRLTNTFPGLIGPYISFGLPVAIYIMTSFFKEVSSSIQESAVIDGAGPLRIYWNIMLPISVPAVSTAAILNFLGFWNEFILAMTMINSTVKKTLPLGMRDFYSAETVNIPAVLTAVLIGSFPVIVLYVFAQERVINGLSAGAVKG
jgi:raffinose/stachyose/melibiose transport system permease protein